MPQKPTPTSSEGVCIVHPQEPEFRVRLTPQPRAERREKRVLSKSDVKKIAGVASLVLGVLGWLGQKFQWFASKVTDSMSFLSFALGLVATAA
jgi:hypothetical protein